MGIAYGSDVRFKSYMEDMLMLAWVLECSKRACPASATHILPIAANF